MSSLHASGRASEPPLTFIGRNSRGHWVVQDESGRHGGLFVDRTAALRFALFENGNRPDAVVMVSRGLELNLGAAGQGGASPPAAIVISEQTRRRIA